MLRHRYGWTLALTCALVFAFNATASARALSWSSQTFRATFARVDFQVLFATAECTLTLEGSFHSRTLTKTAGALVGAVTRGTIGACARGSATLLQERLPWNGRYRSYSGTLPNVTVATLDIVNGEIQARDPTFGTICLFRLSPERGIAAAFAREAGGALTQLTLSGEVPTSCSINGAVNARSNSLTVLNSASRITVTLI